MLILSLGFKAKFLGLDNGIARPGWASSKTGLKRAGLKISRENRPGRPKRQRVGLARPKNFGLDRALILQFKTLLLRTSMMMMMMMMA